MRWLPVLAAMVPSTPKAVTKQLRNLGRKHYPHSQERQGMEAPASWHQSPQRYPGSYAPAWQEIWKKWSGDHRRSLVETKMRCFKLLGKCVMARDFDR